MGKQKAEVEYRYYEMPVGHYVLALLGDTWIRNYAADKRGLEHFHNYLEIGYNYWGEGNLLVEEEEIPYSGDMISILPANIPHSTESVEGGIDKWEYLFIDIEGFVLKEMKELKRFPHDDVLKVIEKNWYLVSNTQNPSLANVVRGIMGEYREKRPHYKDMVLGYLRCLVVELIRLSESAPGEASQAERLPSYVEKSIKFISDHYADDLKIEDIADASGLSESHFRRLFEDSMKIKPLDYLNLIRVDKACELLSREELSMEEIAYRVGFQNISTFNRNFKKMTDTNPMQWKKAAQNGDLNKNYKVSIKKGW